jgi:hypothetical protein
VRRYNFCGEKSNYFTQKYREKFYLSKDICVNISFLRKMKNHRLSADVYPPITAAIQKSESNATRKQHSDSRIQCHFSQSKIVLFSAMSAHSR